MNRELVVLYCSLGRHILSRQKNEGWSEKIIDRLSGDLAKAFPEMRGFRVRNLKYMRVFAEAYSDQEFVQQVVAQLPWGHRVRILDAVIDPNLGRADAVPSAVARSFRIRQEAGWICPWSLFGLCF
jgi:predicted nuclease of restriction endonuclease-like (RecB) superfamily